MNVFFWYRPTRVVPDQRPLNGRCCCCCSYGVLGDNSSAVVEDFDVDAASVQHAEADRGEPELRRGGLERAPHEQSHGRVRPAAGRQRLPGPGAVQCRRHVRLEHTSVGQYHPQVERAGSVHVVRVVESRAGLVRRALYRRRRNFGCGRRTGTCRSHRRIRSTGL